jgi:outer membrane protein, multidrug efflux system
MKIRYSYLLPISSAFFTACLTPHVDEKTPTYALENSWKNAAAQSTPSVEIPATPDNWWEAFEDNKLNDIVTEGLQKSPTIEQAFARFEQALCLAKVSRADQFPQLALNGYGDRRRIPKDLQSSATQNTGNFITPTTPVPLPNPSSTGVPPISTPPIIVPAIPEMTTIKTPTYVNDLIANLLISYELDFWGKYYLKTQAANKRAEEAEADLATARLLLVDQIAATYFTIQAMESELALIREEIATHTQRNALLSQQCNSGLTNTFQLLDEQATLETKKS